MEFKLKDSFGYILNSAAMKMARSLNQKLNVYDITPYQFGTLSFLQNNEGITQRYLADNTYEDEATTKRVVDRLIDKELLIREKDDKDKRAYKLFLTKKGRDLIPKLIELAEKTNEEFLNNFTKDELDSLQSLIKKL